VIGYFKITLPIFELLFLIRLVLQQRVTSYLPLALPDFLFKSLEFSQDYLQYLMEAAGQMYLPVSAIRHHSMQGSATLQQA